MDSIYVLDEKEYKDVYDMHAVLVGNQGKLVWSPVPDPVLKDDDVLLEIHAAALNRADLLQRAGQYPPPEG